MNNSKKYALRFKKLWVNSGAMTRTFQVDFELLWLTEHSIKEAQEKEVDILVAFEQKNCWCEKECECPVIYGVDEVCVINPLLLGKMRRNLKQLGWRERDHQIMSLPIFSSGLDCDDFILRLSHFGHVQDLLMGTLTPMKVVSVSETEKAPTISPTISGERLSWHHIFFVDETYEEMHGTMDELQSPEDDLGHGVCPTCRTSARVAENHIGGGAAHGGDEFYCYGCCGTF